MKQVLELRVNGNDHTVMVEPRDTLADVLRKQLGLIGTKEGCGHGECGACTVLVDGRPVVSCITLSVSCQGKDILTIEGLAENGKLHAIQQAFIDNGAVQCGFCTPGMILSAKALLDEHPDPTEDQIRTALSGNLCRCTGYVKIVEAVHDAARRCRGVPESQRSGSNAG